MLGATRIAAGICMLLLLHSALLLSQTRPNLPLVNEQPVLVPVCTLWETDQGALQVAAVHTASPSLHVVCAFIWNCKHAGSCC